MKKRRNLTTKRLAAVWAQTSSCYFDAVKEYGISSIQLRDLYTDELITQEEFSCKMEELDEVYRRKLCELSSDIIEDVIKAHAKSLQMRAKKTIDSLTIELLERHLNDEEGRSS